MRQNDALVEPLILPLEKLGDRKKCQHMLEVRRNWPTGIPLTEDTLERVLKLRLDIDAVYTSVLNHDGRKAFNLGYVELIDNIHLHGGWENLREKKAALYLKILQDPKNWS